MGRREDGQGQFFYSFDLDKVVPPDHLVRQIDGLLDLGWVHKELAPYYSHTGRPSIDPVLMIRMLLVGYVFAIRSERRTCAEVQVNLAEMLGANVPAKPIPLARSGRQARFSGESHLDSIREERVTPLVQGPHEVRLRVDCSTFAIAPFSSVGIERKVSNVVVAGLFPMLDRQRLTIVLAIQTGLHAF